MPLSWRQDSQRQLLFTRTACYFIFQSFLVRRMRRHALPGCCFQLLFITTCYLPCGLSTPIRPQTIREPPGAHDDTESAHAKRRSTVSACAWDIVERSFNNNRMVQAIGSSLPRHQNNRCPTTIHAHYLLLYFLASHRCGTSSLHPTPLLFHNHSATDATSSHGRTLKNQSPRLQLVVDNHKARHRPAGKNIG